MYVSHIILLCKQHFNLKVNKLDVSTKLTDKSEGTHTN